ncbi:DegT/DnrJ/EryC1/StrS family aminotransferase [Ekhidna sp. MALMAid0563]|uniref:DegT/DnrJ/EryC1/StrS family aminotransferase n=1 Tax=Ekhidna sp. MALMAid0563 TaxID=3143937 RepID=UPI0032DF17F2
MIPVTKPFLPPKEEVIQYLDEIWERNWFTNDGPLVKMLEDKLRRYLELEHLLFVSNGTIALQIALKALKIEGEVITTPFSYVATTSSIVWENCTPVFVDIDPETWNIDPVLIEKSITKETTAILATHVFGNPCDVDAIQNIANSHGLKVIYDSAHAFGSTYKDKPIMTYGDINAISFHATKLYHTVEGGAIVTNSLQLAKRMMYMRNFGHDGPGRFNGIGINGKNSEVHAAVGLVNLNYANEVLTKRRDNYDRYKSNLQGEMLTFQKINDVGTSNHSYMPVLFQNEKALNEILTELNDNNIFPRRYFYPSLDELDYVESGKMKVSQDISSRILCLPTFHDLTINQIDFICSFFKK